MINYKSMHTQVEYFRSDGGTSCAVTIRRHRDDAAFRSCLHAEGKDYVKDIIEQMGYSRTGKRMEDILNEESDPAVGARR